MRDPAGGIVGHGAAQLLFRHFFVRHRLDHVGPGNEHVRSVFGHKNEIGDGGRIDCAAGARSEDGADLRNNAAGQRVAQKNLRITGQRHHSFLNARAAGIVEPDDGRPDTHGQVHNFTNFARVRFRERSAKDREILREEIHQAPANAAVSGDKAVAGRALLFHAEIGAVVRHEFVELLEAALVEQERDALAHREFPCAAFTLTARRTPAFFRSGAPAPQLG